MDGAALPKRYLNVDEVALYIGVPKSTIYRMVEGRDIPFIRLGGKHTIRFDVRALDRWMEKQLIPAKPQPAA